MGNITNQEVASSMTALNPTNALAPLVHEPPPDIYAPPPLPKPFALPQQVAEYAVGITTLLARNDISRNLQTTNHRQLIINAFENEVRAQIVSQAPQLGISMKRYYDK